MEIEFRAWDKKTQEMYDVVGIDFRNKKVNIGYFENPHWGSRARDLGDVVLEQCTGIKDDEMIKVYGGDRCIVTAIDYYSSASICMEEGDEFVGVVKMDDCMWVVRAEDGTVIPFCDILCEEMGLKVIGNVHE